MSSRALYHHLLLVLTGLVTLTTCQQQQQECPPCDLTTCDTLNCVAGQVYPEGPCPCCAVCALDEGWSCYNASIQGLEVPEIKVPCGENLACLLRPDLSPRDKPEALCFCKQVEAVCGSDNRTYESPCHLRREAHRGHRISGPLYVKTWGPCRSAPWVTSAPEDAAGALHQNMALDCEAKGYPIPDIHWEFTGDDGETKNLPSDDLHMAVQMRGGPESFMVTSWVQVVDLRPINTGVYTCVATNSEGVARASAKIGVYQNKKRRQSIN